MKRLGELSADSVLDFLELVAGSSSALRFLGASFSSSDSEESESSESSSDSDSAFCSDC